MEMTQNTLANALLVTTGFLSQLESGIRPTAEINNDFARACAKYLRVPAIVVMLVAGSISHADLAVQEDIGGLWPGKMPS
jgi:transcriptional regulator with XRE-family HTH domain